jgi:hypothetical protein
MRQARGRVLAAGIAAVLVAAGCGDDDEDTTTAAAPTKQEFIEQGDAICEEGDQEIDAAGQETFSGGRPSPEEQQQFITETVVPNVQGQIDDLRALTPPEGDEEQVNQILDTAQEELDALEQDPQAGFMGEPFAQAEKLLKDYGFEVCAQG